MSLTNGGPSTTFLHNLFYHLSNLIIKYILFIFNWNLPFKCWKATIRSLVPSLLQAELAQPFFTEICSSPLDRYGPSLDLLPHVYVFIALETMRLDSVLQVGVHEAGTHEKGQNHHLLAMFLLMLPRIQLSFCTASAHCWLMPNFFIHKYSQVLLPKAVFNPFILQSVLISGSALSLIELHLLQWWGFTL